MSDPVLTVMDDSDKELVMHMKSMLDELKWFHAHHVVMQIKPTPAGWTIKFCLPDKSAIVNRKS